MLLVMCLQLSFQLLLLADQMSAVVICSFLQKVFFSSFSIFTYLLSRQLEKVFLAVCQPPKQDIQLTRCLKAGDSTVYRGCIFSSTHRAISFLSRLWVTGVGAENKIQPRLLGWSGLNAQLALCSHVTCPGFSKSWNYFSFAVYRSFVNPSVFTTCTQFTFYNNAHVTFHVTAQRRARVTIMCKSDNCENDSKM